MRNSRRLMSVLLIVLLSVMNLFAQNVQLSERSAIGINLGMYSGSKASNISAINGMKTEVMASGFSGGVFFQYWLQEDLALKLNAGMLTGNAKVSVNIANVSEQASSVMPITLGLNYYLLSIIKNDAVRPYFTAAVGMYVGNEAKNSILSQQVHSENAFGGKAGAGVDFILGNHFILGANAGYNLMSNFENPVGGNKNYNGAEFLFQFEYVF